MPSPRCDYSPALLLVSKLLPSLLVACRLSCGLFILGGGTASAYEKALEGVLQE